MVAQVIKNQIEKIEYREKKFFWVLFTIFIFCVISYGFLLNSMVQSGVAQQNMQNSMVTMGSNVSKLEFQYLNIKNSITLALAQSKGFVNISSQKFAVINPSAKNISLSINEN